MKLLVSSYYKSSNINGFSFAEHRRGNSTEVEFYITPTGTETYKLQQLIDFVNVKNGVAEFIWDVPQGTMGHFWIVAYNKNVGRKSDLINVIRQN